MENTKTNSPAFTNLIDLAAERLGGKAIICSDDFFAEKENLLKPGRGIFIADKYTDRGKWMDGWESRRKRVPGYDWCIIKLGASGIIKGFDIDTNFFLGNHPPHASIEACNMPDDATADALQKASWVEILAKSPLNPGSQNFYEVDSDVVWTHLRLNIYPDGGVARLKVYGEVYKNWNVVKETDVVDLASATNGGKSILCNDMFFSHMDNLIMPGRGVNMGDGWETKRNRTPNNRDWVIVKLAHQGNINKILVDTCHFKGNYPDTCSIEGIDLETVDLGASSLGLSRAEVLPTNSNIEIETVPLDEININSPDIKWTEILPKQKLQADHEHFFEKEIANHGPFTHIRLNIFPDGGVSRLRLFGNIKK
ncbi:MAG TPA: allantoicase [Bacteroidia bacterium]|nr:allantoicase [Bacteroidia bacterium]